MTQEAIPAPSSDEVAGAPTDVVEQAAPETETDVGLEETVDWNARAVEAEGRIEKLEQSLRTAEGRVGRRNDQDAILQGLGDRFDGLEKSNSALVRALASGNTDDLSGELTEIEQQSVQSRTDAVFQNGHAALWNELQEVIKAEDGTDVMDPQTAPEFASIRSRWNERAQAKDLGGIALLLTEANKIVRGVERAGFKKALADEKTARKAERKKVLDDVGALDNDTGSGAGAGGNYNQARDAYIANPIDPKVAKRYAEARAARGL